MSFQLSFGQRKKIISLIKSRLYPNGKLLYLSLVGNAVFGWGIPEFSQEIYGIFVHPKFWDKVYLNTPGFYITLFNLEHLLYHEYSTHKNLMFFAKCSLNFSNPFYVDKNFDYKTLLSFHKPSVILKKSELSFDWLYFPFSIDGILRTYHFLLLKIYYLKTQKIELDIFKLAKKCNFNTETISKLKKEFLETFKKRGEVFAISKSNIVKVRKELKELSLAFQKLKEKMPPGKINYLEFEMWKQKIKKTYNI